VNANYARKLVKDNNLDIAVKGRSNGIINFYTESDEDLRTLRELLLGMGITLEESPSCFYIDKTIEKGAK